MEKKLFLLDGHALVFRAHYAFINRPLINSKGINTSAATGFTRQLLDILKNEKPSHLAVVFDPPTLTFRNDWYPEYKANREETPDDIRAAIPQIRQILDGFRIPVLSVDYYEADDVIGTLAKQAENEGFTVYMVTPDKDYGQLVSEQVFMYKPSRQGNGVEVWGKKEVLENWQIKEVSQVIDMLGLQGDSVDNIPGVPGIGPKTAATLLDEFETVENLISNADKIKGKNQEKIKQFAEQALLSKKLATIDINSPVQFHAELFSIKEIDKDKLADIFKELEFRSLANQVLGVGEETQTTPAALQGTLFDPNPGTIPTASGTPSPELPAAHSVADKNIHNTPHTYHLADSVQEHQKLVTILQQAQSFCFDTETTDIDPNLAELVGMSFSIKSGEAWYVPVPAKRDEAMALLAIFKPVFENPAIQKIGQNIKYDAIMLKWYGIEVAGDYFDTMVAHYLLEPEKRHNMDYLSETYLGYEPVSIESLLGKKGKNQLTMRDMPVEQVKDYAAEDADITWQLHETFAPLLKENELETLFKTLETPLTKVLVDMEYEGINLDTDYLAKYSVELAELIVTVEKKIYESAGKQFNIASPKQVGELLFDTLKIPYRWKKTATGQYATSEDKLAELSGQHIVIDMILEHRGLNKLLSTYVDALPKMVNPKTGRVHSSFNQALAATGRLSSNNPNLQNIPIRTQEGAKVREAFIPRDNNHVLLSADYSQIELRLIAELSNDEAMLEAFQQKLDIHRATAAKVFGVAFDAVTSEQRYRAKTVNFSIIYGAGATNLSQQLGIKRTEATELINAYFAQYQGLKSYMDETIEFARKNGYVATLLGRKRYLRDIHSKSGLERSIAERVAINSPVQGTAADLVKVAMINIHHQLREQKLATKMILQVHDELLFDVPLSELEQVKPLIEEHMTHAMPTLRVPLEVSLGSGKNWREAH